MNFLKQNMRWLALVLLLMCTTAITSVVIGHAFFVYYLGSDIESYKDKILQQLDQDKPFRISI